MLSRSLGKRCDRYVDSLVMFLKDRFPSLSPNVITVLGVIPHVFSAIFYGLGEVEIAGFLVLLGGFFDMLDGAFARTTGNVTNFGGVLDSTIDRCNDFLPWVGIIYSFSKSGEHLWVVLSLFTVLFIFLVPYVRARAEKIVDVLNTGLMERPERVISLFLFSVFDKVKWAVVFIGVLSFITALQRVRDARKRLP